MLLSTTGAPGGQDRRANQERDIHGRRQAVSGPQERDCGEEANSQPGVGEDENPHRLVAQHRVRCGTA